jgi:hypothetical protein
MSEPKRDPGLDEELQLLSQAYRNLAHDEPAPELDIAIRAAARREAGARPKPVRESRLMRWRAPLAAAAVVILSVSTILLSVHERPDAAPPEVRAVVIPQMGTAPSAENPMEASRPLVAEPMPGRLPTPASPVPPQRGAPQRKAKSEEAKEFVPPVDSAARTDATQLSTLAAPEVQGLRKESAPQASPRLPQPSAAAPAQQLSQPSDVATAPATGGAAMPSMAAEPAKRRATGELAQTAPGVDELDPEKWLKQIADLRKDGKAKEAEESLAKFRARYPDYPLPREWLQRP